MATQGVVVPIQAKIEGWQEQIKQIQNAMKNVQFDSGISKSVGKDLEKIIPMIAKLGQTMNQRLTSDQAIAKFTDTVQGVEEGFGRIGRAMSKVTMGDLKLDYINENFKEIKQSIEEATDALDKGMEASFKSAISESSKMQKAFSILSINPDNMNVDEIREALAKGAEKLTTEVNDMNEKANFLTQNIKTFQAEVDKLEKSKIAGLDTKAEAKRIVGDQSSLGVEKTLNTEFLNSLSADIESKLGGAKDRVKQHVDEIRSALTELTSSTTIEDAQNKLTKLQELFGSYGAKGDFGFDKAGFKDKTQQLVQLLPDENAITAKMQSIRQALVEDGVQEKDIQSSMMSAEKFIRAGQFEKLPELFQDVLLKTQSGVKYESSKLSETINQMKAELAASASDSDIMKKAAQKWNVDQAIETLNGSITEGVNKSTSGLRETLKGLWDKLASESTAGVKKVGESITQSSNAGISAATMQLQQYQQALAQVKSTETMVSKVQGFVQRWFSIYTVMRMARKAINEVTSTIKSLDTTMTDIAIATKMSQDDLWGQMPQYAAMAQKYAASISGVYEVSKLYYQQGLQGKDVTSLTEATLKMARVSGLDYSESADYMTNAVRSFKMEMEDANHVVDVYSAVAASSASNAKELATAMSKTAASAQAVGSSFENTTAMLAVMIEATRESPENIGSAMKSIISRYGELKEHKVGIDSEGEAYSLNKVDTALQTVGISIHDANGEFRDFDDVIMDLSKNWDTIDKNTQRYIATIMAGNRQQSRFLSLVSSYDRLREESEKAANSEDASQIQFLKSLESVDGKLQQLKTSMQSLYVESGLEKTYKGLIDFTTALTNSLSAFSGKAGLGAAIASIGGSFTTMATLATTAFSTIKKHYASTQSKIISQNKLDLAKQDLAAKQKALEDFQAGKRPLSYFDNGKINDEEGKKWDKQEAALQESRDEAKKNVDASQAAEDERAALQRAYNRKQGRMIGAGMAAAAAGTALSTWGNAIDVNENRGLKAGLTIGGSALSGIGTGLMVGAAAGGPWGAIVGFLSGLPGVIQGIGIIEESVEEKISKLEKDVTDTSNERIKSKNDLKTLEDYKKKYDELNQSQYQSLDKKQEFIDLQNEIASTYPELIKNMDEEGNYIVSMTEGYAELARQKREAYKSDLIENAAADTTAVNDIDYVLKNIYGRNPITSNKMLGITTTDALDKLKSLNYNPEDMEGFGTSVSEALQVGGAKNTLDRLFTENDFNNDKVFKTIDKGFVQSLDVVGEIYAQFMDAITQDMSASVAKKSIGSKLSEKYGEGIKDVVDAFDTNWYNELKYRYEIPDIQLKLSTNKVNTYTSELSNILSSSVEDAFNLESSSVQKRYLQDLMMSGTQEGGALSWQQYWDAHAEELRTNKKSWSDAVTEFLNQYDEGWYKLQRESDAVQGFSEKANDFYEHLGEYTESDIDKLFPNTGAGRADQVAWLKKVLAKDYEDITSSYNSWYQDLGKANFKGLTDFSSSIAPKYLEKLQSTQKQIVDNESLTFEEQQAQLTALDSVYNAISSDQLDYNSRNAILGKVQAADFTSLFGIYSLFEEFDDLDINFDQGQAKEVKAKLTDFSTKLKVNIPAELNSYVDALSSAAEGFEKDLSSATSGMNIKDAAEMAGKLGKGLSNENFEVRDGKFYYNNIDDIKDVYSKKRESYEKALQEIINDAAENTNKFGKALGGERTPLDINSKDLQLDDNVTEQFEKDFEKSTEMDYDSFVSLYKRYKDSEYDSFGKFLQEILPNEIANIDQWINQQAAIAKLKSQGFEAFTAEVASQNKDLGQLTEQQNKMLLSAAMSQNFDELKTQDEKLYSVFEPYFSTLISTFKNTKASVLNSLIGAIGTGKEAGITLDASNIPYLQELGLIDKDADQQKLIGQKLKDIIDQVDGIKDKIRDGILNSLASEAEQLEMFQQLHDNEYKRNQVSGLTTMAQSTVSYKDFTDYLHYNRGFSVEAIEKGGVLEREAETYGLAMDAYGNYYVENWSANITQLQSDLDWALTHDKTAEGKEITTKDRNALRAAVANAKLGQSKAITEAGSALLKSYDDIQVSQQQALADALGLEDVDQLLQQFYYKEDGRTKLNIAAFREALESGLDIPEEAQKALLDGFVTFADDAMSAVNDIMSYTSQGTNKQADIQKVVKQFKGKYTGDQLFKFDDTLNAYTFQSQYLAEFMDIQADAYAAAMGVSKADALSQIQKQTQRTAAAAVDLQGYMSAERQGEGSLAYEKLSKQLIAYEESKQNFIREDAAYYDNLGMTSDEAKTAAELAKQQNEKKRSEAKEQALQDIKKLTSGGKDAIEMAQSIASAAGIELTAQELQDIYAPYAAKLSDMGAQIAELSAGQFVDATSNLGQLLLSAGVIDESGIVKNINKITDAYKEVYERLADGTTNASVAQINTAAAQYLSSQNLNKKTAIEAISGGATITEEALTNIYTLAGETFGQYKETITEIDAKTGKEVTRDIYDADAELQNLINKGIIEDLGAGEMRLTEIGADWLADYLKLDKNSKQYKKAVSELRDSIIAEDESYSELARATKQISTLSSATAGQIVNIDTLPDNIKEKLGVAGQNTIQIVSEAQRDSMLAAIDQALIDSVDDPALKALLESIRSQISSSYMSQMSKATSLTTAGTTDLAEMENFQKSFNELMDATATIDYLFDYNTITNSWTLKAEALSQMLDKEAKKLVADGRLSEEDIGQWKSDQLKANTIDKIDFNSIFSSAATDKSREAVRQAIESYYVGQVELLSDDSLLNRLINAGAVITAQGKAKTSYETLLQGGRPAMEELKKLKEDATPEELQAAYDYTISPIREVLSTVEDLKKGSVVAKGQIDTLRAAGFDVTDDGLITSVSDLVTAYGSLYQQIKSHANANTMEINDAYAKYLTATEQGDIDAVEAMGEAMGMTYETLGNFLGKNGKDLESWLTENRDLYTNIGAGKIRIDDFTGFAKGMGWEPGSEQYTDAFKTYNDSMIELNKKNKDRIKDEMSQFTEAKPGDQINLSDTWSQVTARETEVIEDYQTALSSMISNEEEAKAVAQDQVNAAKERNQKRQEIQDQLVSDLEAAGVAFDEGIATLGENVDYAKVQEAFTNYYNNIGMEVDTDTAAILDTLANKNKAELSTAYTNMMQNWQAITPEMIQSFVEAGGASSYETAKQMLGLQVQGDGTYKLTLADLQESLKWADIADIAKTSIMQSLADLSDNWLNNITTATSLLTSGTSNQADIQKFLTSARELGVEASDAFSYDSLLDAWTLDPKVMANYVKAQAQELVDQGLMTTEAANDYLNTTVVKGLASKVDVKGFLSAEVKGGQAEQKLRKSLTDFYTAMMPDYETVLGPAYQEVLKGDITGETAKQIYFRDHNKTLEQTRDDLVENDIRALAKGGIAAVEVAQRWAAITGEELSSSDIEAAYKAQVSQVEKASEQLTYGVGQLVTGDAIAMLANAGYKLTNLGASNTAVITSIGDIADAYVSYYDALQSSGEATLEALNNAKAKVLETKEGRYAEQKAIDALGEASGMTYSTFAQLMTDMGIEVTDDLMSSLESSGIIESLGGAKMRIKDFAAFARAMKWDFNSEEYIGAFSTYNDGLIEYNKKAKEAVGSELEGLKDIKPGDQLNLTKTEKAFKDFSKSREAYIKQAEQEVGMTNSMEANYIADQYALEDTFFNNLQNTLHGYGAHLQDGILSLSENANLLGVAETLKSAALKAGTGMTAELADMVQSIVDSYTNAITKGIEGGMTNVEKEDLIRKGADMGITHKESDFYQTADGWQMSTQAGMAYYNAMTNVDIRSRKKIYNSLSKTLKETNNSYKTTTSMLARMGELTRELEKLNEKSLANGDKRKEQLQDELNFMKEMYANSLSHRDDSWNFLSQNPFSEGMENALTFWENVGQLNYQMSQWNMGKKVTDMDTFSAAVKEAYEMSQALGHSVEFAGMKIGDEEGALSYGDYLSQFTDFTYYDPKTGKIQSTAAMLAKLGFDLGKGGLDEASVKEFTERNAQIMEAFESFGESMLGIQNTLNDYSDDNFGHSFEDFVEGDIFNSKRFLDQMKTNSKNYESFKKFADKVNINGKSLNSILNSSNGQIKATDDNFKAMQGLFKAAMSDGVDLEHSYQAVADILSQNGFEGKIKLYDTTYDIRGGRAIFKGSKDKEWTGPDGKTYKTPEQAFDAYNRQDLQDLSNQLNNYSQTKSNNNEYKIPLRDKNYTLTIDEGKGTFTDPSTNKTYSSIAEFQNDKYNEYAKAYEKTHAGKKAVSQADWWTYQTSTSGEPFGATSSLSAKSRQAMVDAGMVDVESVRKQWAADVSKYGAEGAAIKWKAEFDVEPEVNGDKLADGVAEQLGKAVASDPLIANSVADGISKAFNLDSEGGSKIAENLGQALTKALTQDGVDIPELKLNPSSVTMDAANVQPETLQDMEIPAGNVNVTPASVNVNTEGITSESLKDMDIPGGAVTINPSSVTVNTEGVQPEAVQDMTIPGGTITIIPSNTVVDAAAGAESAEGGNQITIQGQVTYSNEFTTETPPEQTGGTAKYDNNEFKKQTPPTLTGGTAVYTPTVVGSLPTLTGTAVYNVTTRGGCFVAGTQIIMSNYKMKNIEDIKVGEQVLAYNDELEQFEVHTVTKSYEHHDTPRVLRMELSNGIILGITPGHPILTTTGWKSRDIANSRWEHNTEADWLNIGDEVIGYFGNAKVVNIKELDIPEHYTTYNIEVETCHTFLADGIVVHNAKSMQATGNVGLAHAKSTLMGELGPEMVVSNGRYFVVGQNGPEFVDLAEDAIVFNHLQTQSLLEKGTSTTRGQAITNERKAVAYAHGNINGGPAHDWANWTNQWRYGNTTWRGGGNMLRAGTGGGADDTALEGYLKNLEKWYNLLQEIAKLEEKITYQEQLRAKISSDLNKNGKAYYASQKKSLADISKQITTEQTLVAQQEIERSTRMGELKDTLFGKMYYLDEDGQLKQNDKFRAEFDKVFKGGDNGAPPKTVQEQYDWLKKQVGEDALRWDSSGKEIKFTGDAEKDQAAYKTAVEAALKRMEDQQSEIQGLTDSINDKNEDILAQEQARNEILAEMRDNQLEVENMVLDAIVEIRERAIDEMQNERDIYADSTDKMINGLTEALNNEKTMYDMQSNQEETDKMRRRLAILQSSGGSASEIMNLQDQIQQRDKDMYFEQAQRQIDAIQQASDKELEKLDEQITVEKEVLEYEKLHGLLWNEVYKEMLKSPQEIASFIAANTQKYWGMSEGQALKEMDETLFKTTQWDAYRTDTDTTFKNMLAELRENNGRQQWKEASASLKATFGDYFDKYNANGELEKIYLDKYKETSDPNQAIDAVKAEINRKKKEEEEAAKKKAALQKDDKSGTGQISGGSGGNTVWVYGKTEYKTKQAAKDAQGKDYNTQITLSQTPGIPAAAQKSLQQAAEQTKKKPIIQTKPGSTKTTTPKTTTKVTGNAFAKGTLLGELGPEAWVANGKLHISGQNGAEMVNLPNDAIVFNHQQTARLLSSGKTGRGTAINGEDTALDNKNRESYISSFWDQVARNRMKTEMIDYPTYATSSTLENINSQLQNNNSNESMITIEHAEVNMRVEHMNNDYDARRAGEQALEEMLRIARKNTVTSIRR